jgi:manganese/zinc/iron transport system ATP- binding protein
MSPLSQPVLEVHDLTVSYGKGSVLYGIDFALQSHRLVGVLGPNGAGKSTLMKAIMGNLIPTSGWVKIFGLPPYKALKYVGYVPQREAVDWDFPISVLEVVLMGRYGHVGIGRKLRPIDNQIAEAALEKVGLIAFRHRPIGNLSGGQQQRVFLARALAQEADLYLMDEPFAGVDATTEGMFMQVLQDLKKEGKTLMVVHHDLGTAKCYFDEVLLINMRLVAHGPAETVLVPEILHKTYGGRLTLLSEIAQQRGGE